jgi:RHS repeat-associated protein
MRKHPILKTIYFDNGCVFRSSSQTQLQYLINIIDETSIAQSITLKVEYTDLSTSIANIKTDDLIIGATGNYQSFSKTGKFIFPNPVQIDKIVLVTTCTDATVKNYEQICGTNFTIGTGKTMQIQARTNVANITSSSSSVGKELIAVYYPKDITFESSNFGDGRIVVDYTHGGTQPYTYEYFLKDHQGSTRMVINDQGSITEAVMYQPYGTMLDVPGGVVSPIPVREKYTGKEFDFDGAINGAPGINLLYFGARSYDPDIGVWTSADPAEQYWNLYSYCGGNPVVLVDPDGQWAAALIFGLFELAVNYLVHSITSGDWDPTSNNTFSNTTFSAGYSYGTGPGSPEGVYIGINDGRVYPGWSERTDNGSSTTITLRNNYNVDLGLQLLIDNKGVNEYIKDFYIKSYEPLLVASNDLKIKTEYDCGIGGGDIATDAIDMQLYLSASNSGTSSFKENLTRNLYTLSDITNQFSTDMALLGVGNQILTGGVPTQLSTVPYGISLGSYTVSVLAGGAGDFLRGDYKNLGLRATAAVPQYFINFMMGSKVAEQIFQGATGNYFDTYVKNPYRP